MNHAVVTAVAVTISTAVAGGVLTAPARAGARVPASQPLLVLEHDHIARARPSVWSRRIETVPARRPLTGVRTVLPVIGRATSQDGRKWARVRLPGRPSGHTGWLPTSRTRRSATPWRLALDLSARRVTVYEHGRVSRRFSAVIGTASTPTPRGRFFIEEGLALSGGHGGPFALATSARSAVLQEFDGGPGQIALHGTNGLSGALGTAASHGCIRLSTSSITWLARRIGAGVPLTVTA
jgi:lipoprotein-anchoring transpeptidase ErfK/SrfK